MNKTPSFVGRKIRENHSNNGRNQINANLGRTTTLTTTKKNAFVVCGIQIICA